MNNSGTQITGESGFLLLERGDQGASNRIIHIISHKFYVGSARYFSKTNVSRLATKMSFELLGVCRTTVIGRSTKLGKIQIFSFNLLNTTVFRLKTTERKILFFRSIASMNMCLKTNERIQNHS